MPSTITSSAFENQTPGQALCDAFQEKLLNNSKMRAFLDYFFLDPDGVLNTGFIGDLLTFLTPIGTVIWIPKTLDASVSSPSNGAQWLEANNQRLAQADYARLFAFYGLAYNIAGDNAASDFRVPDLQGKFLLNRSPSHDYGTTGGEESHVLTADENGPHNHLIANEHSDTTGPGDPTLGPTNFLQRRSSNGHDNPDYALHGDAGFPTVGLSQVSGGAVSLDADAVAIPGYTDKYKATAHNTMPPYFTGVAYVLAGYKVNGVMV